MTADLAVSATEFRAVRVFALDLSPAEAKAMAPDFLATLLGASDFDAEKSEIVERKTFGDLGLSGYLRDGYGIPEATLAEDKDRLDAPEGLFALIPSSAFKGIAQPLSPRAPLHFIGFYSEHPSRAHDVMEPVAVAPVSAAPVSADLLETKDRSGSALIVLGFVVLLLILALMLLT